MKKIVYTALTLTGLLLIFGAAGMSDTGATMADIIPRVLAGIALLGTGAVIKEVRA